MCQEISSHFNTKYQIICGALHKDPLIYPFCLHSIDHEIAINYSANIKKFPGGFVPRPPYLSFLLTFKGTGDFFSFQQKISNYLWGFDPKPPKKYQIICGVLIQSPLIFNSPSINTSFLNSIDIRFRLILAQIMEIFCDTCMFYTSALKCSEFGVQPNLLL